MTFENPHKRCVVEGEREAYAELVALRVLRPCARVMSHILSSTITGPKATTTPRKLLLLYQHIQRLRMMIYMSAPRQARTGP